MRSVGPACQPHAALVADTAAVGTVAAMDRRRGFSLIEVIAVVAVLLIVASVGGFAASRFLSSGDEQLDRRALEVLAAAQQANYLTRSGFLPTPAALAVVEPSVPTTTGSASTEVVSMAVGSAADGTPLAAFAVVGVDGDCITLTVAPPAAARPQVRDRFIPGGDVLCDGATALTRPVGAAQW